MELQSGIYSLAPSWMQVFDKWNNLKRFQREAIITDIGYFNKNPIAESYGWDNSYFDKESEKYCPECSWFSWSYTYVITGGDILDRPILELKNDQFVEHCNLKHNGHSPSKSPESHITKAHSGSVSSLNGRKRVLKARSAQKQSS